MYVVHESVFIVSRHFSAHSTIIQLLFQRSDAFRETCLDYHECNKALNYWSSLASREALLRQKEYSDLLKELEKEILQAVSYQYFEKTIPL